MFQQKNFLMFLPKVWRPKISSRTRSYIIRNKFSFFNFHVCNTYIAYACMLSKNSHVLAREYPKVGWILLVCLISVILFHQLEKRCIICQKWCWQWCWNCWSVSCFYYHIILVSSRVFIIIQGLWLRLLKLGATDDPLSSFEYGTILGIFIGI